MDTTGFAYTVVVAEIESTQPEEVVNLYVSVWVPKPASRAEKNAPEMPGPERTPPAGAMVRGVRGELMHKRAGSPARVSAGIG
jgi:hypothetical protein